MTRSTSLSTCTILAMLPLLTCAGACSAHAPGRCIESAEAISDASSTKKLVNLNEQGVAIQGYDPVAFFTDKKPVKGDPKFRVVRDGAIYYFASAEHKAEFEKNPTRYEPLYGGWCAYAASIDRLSPIDVEFWEIVDDRLILQHNKKAWNLWHHDPAGNMVKAKANWPGLVTKNGKAVTTLLNVDDKGVAIDGYDPTAYFIDNKPRKGNPAISHSYQGATYHFVDSAHRDSFVKDPAKYIPQFGGFCGYAASINKVSPINPEIWQIQDGRLVLQHTQEAYRLFNKSPAANYAKADLNWPGLAHRRCGKE